MKKKTEKRERRDGLRREYDLSKLKGGVRGKYVARYRAGTNLVLLSPDVAAYFPDEQSVNTALRTLIHAAKGPLRRARRACVSGKEKTESKAPHVKPTCWAPKFVLEFIVRATRHCTPDELDA
jgi:hypothetical protein